jgi:hypothetical protein
MNDLELTKYDFIKNVEVSSAWFANKIYIDFKNGMGLSIIQGGYAHTDNKTEYEIAPINKNGELDGSLFDQEHQGDDILGNCNIKTVNHYINKIGNL